ncbi:MAG TPA: hypothetical protein GXZ90_00195 [Clostridiales bacterium]|nr:hypothetical protein [Clostridiales bacterium]
MKFNKRINTAIALAMITILLSLGFVSDNKMIQASKNNKETVDIRIINTTDLHGQLNSKDYDTGLDYNNGGLARVFNLIENNRKDMPKDNVFTFDAGDSLFDFTTEYIFSEDQQAIQPIYQGMAMVGYDAIVLGNHDFDYGYEYILRQLNETGLRDITVVSNVVDSKTDEYPFNEYMLFTRQMTSSAGKKVQIKVGLIGETIPTFSTKTHSYTGILKAEDIVENVKTKSAKLKDLGADIIVVVAHTGMGPEKPEPFFKNVAYALTKIDDVDVVIGGHEHNLFPTTDMTSPYYRLAGVDKRTGLVNDKNLVLAGDRGRAIGVVDLKLEINNERKQIVDRKTDIKFVDSMEAEDKKIASKYGDWEEALLSHTNEVIADLGNGVNIQNFYSLLDDNSAIQLLNDSKRHYGIRFANSEAGKAYKDYPIIAASTYYSYGEESIEDFVNISDNITESNLGPLQPYNNYLYVYSITGKQLKEWLEWSASAYETTAFSKNWSGSTMASLMKKHDVKSLIKEEWLDNWGTFFIFDGVDYEINPFPQPRYDLSGNKLNNNSRIKNITYNGELVTDKTKMLIVTNKLTKPADANEEVEKQSVLRGFNRSQTVLAKYIKQEAKSGQIIPDVDYNWRLDLPAKYNFIVKVPYYAEKMFESSSYFVNKLTRVIDYTYYIAKYDKKTVDKIAPKIILAPAKVGPTASRYSVAVNVTDASKIAKIQYLKGEYSVNDSRWGTYTQLKDNSFIVSENGVYTVRAQDVHGNACVKTIKIDNFSKDLLEAPTVITYTNRKKTIKGTAEPNSTIVFDAYTGTYKGKVDSKGKYSYALPAQPSGTELLVYSFDEETGRQSEHITVVIKRTGPNQPSVNPIYNNAGFISGNINDSDSTVIAIIDDKVYVPKKDGKKLYENAVEIYNPGLEIIETTVDIILPDFYSISLPSQMGGETVTIYGLDHLSRVSRVNSYKVKEVAPNAPVVYEISNIERTITGYVPGKQKVYEITIIIDKEVYNLNTNNAGEFELKFDEQLIAGQEIHVYAKDIDSNTSQRSFTTKVKVNDIENYVRESSYLSFDEVYDNDYYIEGVFESNDRLQIAVANGKGKNFTNTLYTVYPDEFEEFYLEFDETLPAGTHLYAIYRYTDGNIINVVKTEVLATIPSKPALVNPITNTDKIAEVITSKFAEVELKIGSKTYTSNKYTYDEENDQYVYRFNIDRSKSGTKITVNASNKKGKSKNLSAKTLKLAPNAPKVDRIRAKDNKITGIVEMIAGSDGDTTTTVYASIGKKTYKALAKNDGQYTIKIPGQKEGSLIKIWAVNSAGRGPLRAVKVVK